MIGVTEALQNGVKHSGVRHFTVNLKGTTDSIELTVSDTGKGFETQEALSTEGIGLVSMRERVQMVKGELSIQTALGSGARIYARVPLPKSDPQALAG